MKKEEILNLLEEEVLEEGTNLKNKKKEPIDFGTITGFIDPNILKNGRK